MDTSASGIARLIAFWAGFWTILGAFFWHADRRGFALCKAVRWIFRTNTRPGRIRLGVSLGTGTAVLYRHLVKPQP